jgi:hypothetical protein
MVVEQIAHDYRAVREEQVDEIRVGSPKLVSAAIVGLTVSADAKQIREQKPQLSFVPCFKNHEKRVLHTTLHGDVEARRRSEATRKRIQRVQQLLLRAGAKCEEILGFGDYYCSDEHAVYVLP